MAEAIQHVQSTVTGKFLVYKNRPMVREDNLVCYGSMEDKYFLQLMIVSEKEFRGETVPDKVAVQIISTDPALSASQRIVKQSLQDGFSNALELGVIWLERYLAA